jgi:hypothetical protein
MYHDERGLSLSADSKCKTEISPPTVSRAVRLLSGFDGGKRVPATVAAISDAVRWAEELLKSIDERWPGAKR